MEWKQTVQTVTFYYKVKRECRSLCYELYRQSNSKLNFKLIFENNTVTIELHLRAEIRWPPTCTRNFETMQVEFMFTKQERMPWMHYGNQIIKRVETSTIRAYEEYEIVANEPLSNLVHLLVVRARNFLQILPIGRHVMVQLNNMGTYTSRSYTPVPPCLHPDDMAPNYTTNCLCFMIKKYPNGALSPIITGLQTGQSLLVSNAQGSFIVEIFDRYPVIHMLAAGTGLTVMLGIIQRALIRRNVRTINLLNFNKNQENMFYVQQLERVSGEKLKITHILSQPEDTWTGRRGMVSNELLEELVGKSDSDACVFTCGPRLFLQAAKTSLRDHLDWKIHQMHEFD